jgi:hypothetical protein
LADLKGFKFLVQNEGLGTITLKSNIFGIKA